MKGALKAALCGGAFIACAAAAALLPATAPPRARPVYEGASLSVAYEGDISVIVQGDVSRPGRYRVAYGCTYAELFALAGARSCGGYDLSAPLSFEDAVLADGEYCLFIVV